MSPILEWLNKELKKIEHKCFKSASKVTKVENKPLGDGQYVFISDLQRVIVTVETDSGGSKTIVAIAKFEAPAGPGRDFANACGAYETEIMMYSDVLKSMKKLMTDVGDETDLWPQCYHSGEKKLLIEDLSEDDYRVVPTHKFLDLPHTLLVMKAIGKFHALSLVLKEKGLLKTENFKPPFYAQRMPFMEGMQIQFANLLSMTMKTKWGEEWAPIADRLLKYLEKPSELVAQAWENSRGKWDVLNHGDFNIKNVMFHYGPDSDKPDAAKLIDFQLCHYSNFASDLSTLLYTSLNPRVREENLDNILDTYIESLESESKRHGYKGALPKMEDVKSALHSLLPLRITIFLMSIPMFVLAGKMDIKKQADEFMEKMKDKDPSSAPMDQMAQIMANFGDPDVAALLQYEIKRWADSNVL